MSRRDEPTVRLFVGADPSPAAVTDLEATVRTLEVSRANSPGRSTRVVPSGRWHITLAFLGDVPESKVGRAADAIDAVAATSAPVAVHFAGGGTFGRGAFTILWTGVSGDVAGLRAIAAAVRTQLRSARLPMDEKAFRPHLTLSRPGTRVDPAAIAADVSALSTYAGPQWTIRELRLVQSQLGPDPTYTTRHQATLRG